jgi:Tol biopolymer transport system component
MTKRVCRAALYALFSLVTVACTDATAPVQGVGPLPSLGEPITQYGEQIFIADADGSDQLYLTNGMHPAWSPDGQQIAFSLHGVVHVMDTDGGNMRPLLPGGKPSWSPDGLRLAFTNSSGIAVMNLDGSGATTIVPRDFNPETYKLWDMGVDKATWSPDGRRIAFEHLGDADMQPAQIFVAKADGSGVVRLSRNPNIRYAESDPSWSPDGRTIAHWSYGKGIAVTDVSLGTSITLYANFPFVAYGAKPEWSPDGRFVLFNSFPWGSNTPQLFVVPSSGGSIKTLIANAHTADWSPDGSKIVFVRDGRVKQKR